MAGDIAEATRAGSPEVPVYFRAANGDHDAQLEVARRMLVAGVDGSLPIEGAVSLALVWGHMAATSGRAPHLLGYAGLLLADLSRLTDIKFDDASIAEQLATALALLDAVADAGHDQAAFLSNAMASRMPVSVIRLAVAMKSGVVVEPLRDEANHRSAAGRGRPASRAGIDASA